MGSQGYVCACACDHLGDVLVEQVDGVLKVEALSSGVQREPVEDGEQGEQAHSKVLFIPS